VTWLREVVRPVHVVLDGFPVVEDKIKNLREERDDYHTGWAAQPPGTSPASLSRCPNADLVQ
jgi:hypothetical protein